jgi:predicted nucleic acid-binding protein
VPRLGYDLAVVDERYRTSLVVDASPLIYLAKMKAMDVFADLSMRALIPPAVTGETTRPALIYRHADAAVIEQAVRDGIIEPVQLAAVERARADELTHRIPALHAGEREVLAIALERQIPAMLFERRARNVAKTIGIRLTDVVELLFRGTPDHDQLESRIRTLAQLTDMRLADYDALLARVQRRRLQ